MKYLYLIPLGIALMTVSCKNNAKTASTNPYQNNPYYGPSGSNYKSSTQDYSTSSTTDYPSYSESAYTPPTSNSSSSRQSSTPSVPSVPSYDSPTPSYSGPASSGGYTSTAPSSSAGGSHRVAAGDNLYRISLAHNTSVSAIKRANGLSSDTIHPGQVLRIP